MTRAAVLQTPSKEPNEIPMAQKRRTSAGGALESRCRGETVCREGSAEVKRSERDERRSIEIMQWVAVEVTWP